MEISPCRNCEIWHLTDSLFPVEIASDKAGLMCRECIDATGAVELEFVMRPVAEKAD